MNEKVFKIQYRQDVCTHCPKRQPCADADGICELVTPCAVCEIRDSCTKLCPQMRAYIERGNKKTLPTVPFSLSPKMEDIFSYQHMQNEACVTIERDKLTMNDIPWGAISERDKMIIKEHFLFGKSYEEISKEQNIPAATIFTAIQGDKKRDGALEKLREFAEYQRLLKKFGRFLSTIYRDILVQYYCNFKTIEEIKKIDENVSSAYYRLKKAKKLIMKFTEIEQEEV